jgi:hypothetical protein
MALPNRFVKIVMTNDHVSVPLWLAASSCTDCAGDSFWSPIFVLAHP